MLFYVYLAFVNTFFINKYSKNVFSFFEFF